MADLAPAKKGHSNTIYTFQYLVIYPPALGFAGSNNSGHGIVLFMNYAPKSGFGVVAHWPKIRHLFLGPLRVATHPLPCKL